MKLNLGCGSKLLTGYTNVDKFDFYKRAEKAFTVVMTGDLRIYANLLLVKGVTTWES